MSQIWSGYNEVTNVIDISYENVNRVSALDYSKADA